MVNARIRMPLYEYRLAHKSENRYLRNVVIGNTSNKTACFSRWQLLHVIKLLKKDNKFYQLKQFCDVKKNDRSQRY